MPTGLIHQYNSVSARGDGERYFCQMERHGFGIAQGQYQPCTLAVLRTDSAEDPGRGPALIFGRTRPCPPLGPAARDLVLLADARLVLEPNLYGFDVDRLFARDFTQARGEVFLKSSIAPAACA